ncbi:MAG: ABC transporter ATP-binding protein [Deltaproteobacteria bacterium HGW-Deltaproteobacteria-6]|jgi:lipopolysaccharide transport system ATP-binding protein|nr:MAG: ABC transporter ATP-binding protein [Deltaproteobacteria bacterium HGW-Deltaproteobacteria-6]
MSDVIIKAENLGKKYIIGHQSQQGGYTALRDVLMQNARIVWDKTKDLVKGKPIIQGDTTEEVWALNDVSFEVRRGEAVGIIGRNGAGKSTLLKVLSRITEPSSGRVTINGRVASLLEVGTGFHPELTGRENIYLNGTILGMTRQEIKRKFDEIVAFAEVEKYLDTPVKRYSSGMYVRLAFAVAAHLEPEILVVDEVLAVGDAQFQKKCLGKMGDVTKEGRTVLLVSHNMAAIENLCGKAILMDNGRIAMQGNTAKAIQYYLEVVIPSVIEEIPLAARKDRSGNGIIRLTSFHIEDVHGNKLVAARSGMDIVLVFGYQSPASEQLRDADIGFSIRDKETLSVLYSSYVGQTFETVPPKGQFHCLVKRIPLAMGHYQIGARVTVSGEEADWPRNAVGYLDIEAGDFYGTGREGFGASAPLLLMGQWTIRVDVP